jgi:hypothetical protein
VPVLCLSVIRYSQKIFTIIIFMDIRTKKEVKLENGAAWSKRNNELQEANFCMYCLFIHAFHMFHPCQMETLTDDNAS